MKLNADKKGDTTEYTKDNCGGICYTSGKYGECLQRCGCLLVELDGLKCSVEQESEEWK